MPPIQTIKTKDGSVSLWNSELDETYHSRHGAWNEAIHVFVESGFKQLSGRKEIKVLEVGFGTGLNCYLTALAHDADQRIFYCGLEAYPLGREFLCELNYADREGGERGLLEDIYLSDWELELEIRPNFLLKKVEEKLETFKPGEKFDLVYFDAFGPRAQPEMWEKSVFEKLYGLMSSQGVFVTYCAKGQVRRDLGSCGFDVERLEGPPGKRHMLRGIKP